MTAYVSFIRWPWELEGVVPCHVFCSRMSLKELSCLQIGEIFLLLSWRNLHPPLPDQRGIYKDSVFKQLEWLTARRWSHVVSAINGPALELVLDSVTQLSTLLYIKFIMWMGNLKRSPCRDAKGHKAPKKAQTAWVLQQGWIYLPGRETFIFFLVVLQPGKLRRTNHQQRGGENTFHCGTGWVAHKCWTTILKIPSIGLFSHKLSRPEAKRLKMPVKGEMIFLFSAQVGNELLQPASKLRAAD